MCTHGMILALVITHFGASASAMNHTDVYYSDKKCIPNQACSTTSKMCIPNLSGSCSSYCSGSTMGTYCGDSSLGLCQSGGTASCGLSFVDGTCGTNNTCTGGEMTLTACTVPMCNG